MVYIRRVVGRSMLPKIRPGNIVMALKFLRPKVGDVVIVRHDNKELIKRITEMRHDGIYVLGDNPQESSDSRQYGWLPVSAVLGVVLGAKAQQ